MKAVKIIFGILAGVYTLAQCVYQVRKLSSGVTFSEILIGFSIICIGAAISFALFRSAFKKDLE